MKNEKKKNSEKIQADAPLEDELVRNIVRESARTMPELRPDIFARIEDNLADAATTSWQKGTNPHSPWLERLYNWKDILFRPQVGWGLAAAQAVVLCFFLITSGNHQYQTLSMIEQAEKQMASIDLYVMFRDQATVEEIEKLLNNLQGRIKDGPTNNGIYLVAFADHTVNQPEGLLKKLHNSKIVTFAEQVY